MDYYKGNEFEALKLRYSDQVELLRSLGQFDFKIFTAFFTLQLVLGGWLAANPVQDASMRTGLLIIDMALAGISIKLLRNQHLRRQEVVATIMNLNEALGFSVAGAYLQGKTINPQYKRRFWFWWYAVAVAIGVVGFALVLFGVPINSTKPSVSSVSAPAPADRGKAPPVTAVDKAAQPGSPPDAPQAARR